MECATQKKQTYEITNSMRSIATPLVQAQQSPPIYANRNPPAMVPNVQPSTGIIPVEGTPNAELKANAKVILFYFSYQFLILIFDI